MTPTDEGNTSMHVALQTPKKNVTFAVNYELPMVDRFWHSPSKKTFVEDVPEGTVSPGSLTSLRRAGSNVENNAPNVRSHESGKIAPKAVTIEEPTDDDGNRRRSNRGRQKRQLPITRTRVRYDMELVPPAHRNPRFLRLFSSWWSSDADQHDSASATLASSDNETASPPKSLTAFAQDTSVVWIPSKRSEWEDSVSEMTALCASAGLRQHLSLRGPSKSKPFHAPLSRHYIRDRVDIDDPMIGYQLRHKSGGWLQGFILWTNFTTWTHFFRWDSMHPVNGMDRSAHCEMDADGSLAADLELQTRSGDPFGGGVVFNSIAEIALLGGLGCGEYLLRMALDDIISRGVYKFVVLQATETSRTFYERFGFVRVGAVCRYEQQDPASRGENGRPGDVIHSEVVGYRHWTHANESERSLEMHGGPSYMMCLRLPKHEDTTRVIGGRTLPSFLEAMSILVVEDKPVIEQLGAAPTPVVKRKSAADNPTTTPAVSTQKGTRKSRRVSAKSQRNEGKVPVTVSFNTPLPQRHILPEGHYPHALPSLPVLPPTAQTGKKCRSPSSTSLHDLRGNHDEEPEANPKVEPKRGRSGPQTAKPHGTNPSSFRDDTDHKSSGHTEHTDIPSETDRSRTNSFSSEGADTMGTISAELDAAELPVESRLVDPPAARDGAGAALIRTDAKRKRGNNSDVFSEVQAKRLRTDPPRSPHPPRESSSPQPEERRARRSLRERSRVDETISPRVNTRMSVSRASSRKEDKQSSDPVVREGPRLRNLPCRVVAGSDKKSPKGKPIRAYHSVRDPQGRFVRSADGQSTNRRPVHVLSEVTATNSKTNLPPKQAGPKRDNEGPRPIDKATLVKQKVKSYPRDRAHYYNKVVREKNKEKGTYFFVLHYDEPKATVRIVPMEIRGKLSGKRQGRPRYQAIIGETDQNIQTMPVSVVEVVPALMVMKTPRVAAEAWDILR